MLSKVGKAASDPKVLFALRQGDYARVPRLVQQDDKSLRALFALIVTESVRVREDLRYAFAAGLGPRSTALRLQDQVRLLELENHYEALGLSPEATVTEVQEACRQKLRQFSVERLEAAGLESAQSVGERVRRILREVEATLCSRDGRKRLNERLGLDDERLAELTDRIFDAYDSYKTGQHLLRQGKTREALEAFRKAVRIDPRDHSFAVGMALALVRDEGSGEAEKREALGLAQDALQAMPKRPEFHCAMVEVLLALGDPRTAETHLKKAQVLDPENPEVARLRSVLLQVHKPGIINFVRKGDGLLVKLRDRWRNPRNRR